MELLRVEPDEEETMDTPSPPRGFDAMDLCGTELGVHVGLTSRSGAVVLWGRPTHSQLPVARSRGRGRINCARTTSC